ncbi:methionine biosynthesis protein MetW [Oceanococcus atlanticus]|uniref:Methionine biosynthesis protein MetW n=1 Tax=Oceanococcus atlanticus TaxID=1317117 RepID=A0A1Y1SEM8_9GAMM|nr:methionine biosynthesis protein MetW [Oceanococcus atlanticus]ORE87440.1 methionine biosynthesis protein MetW [Oceanococcus atlanticus]RZO87184.1 MAG: methionine biosynthesis protein MetW [Oceanococcus sp.]
MKPEFSIISEWIEPGSRVLDLGCGDGTLLSMLQRERQVTGYGLDLDVGNIAACIAKGVDAIHTDVDNGLSEFNDQRFDYVVMTQALQVMQQPDQVLLDMLRVGRRGVVTFPNFAHWSLRLQLMMSGRMPRTRALPATWYNTQNIHLCTLKDFEALCQELNIRILERRVSDDQHRNGRSRRWLPNLSGQVGLYLLDKPR